MEAPVEGCDETIKILMTLAEMDEKIFEECREFIEASLEDAKNKNKIGVL